MNATAKNRCSICNTRPIGGGKGNAERSDARSHEMCIPCLDEAYAENEHSDYSHEEIANGADPDEFHGGQATVDQIKAEMAKCMICHPELNQTSAEYVQRTGTSRAGMKINVPLKADGKTKAQTVAELIGGKVTTRKGIVTLKVAVAGGELKLVWDLASGRYEYAASSFTTEGTARRVRNVAQALRIAK